MFDFLFGEPQKAPKKINAEIERFSDEDFIIREIENFKLSARRRDMLCGERYYRGQHDILSRVRTVIGEKGELAAVNNLPNNRVVDNQYKKMVDQKNNYLLGLPITFRSDDRGYADAVKKIFNKDALRLIKYIGEDSIVCGIGWLAVYYDNVGRLNFKRIPPYELIPEWHDSDHTSLDCAIRFYENVEYLKSGQRVIEKVEVYTKNGIAYFIHDGSRLIPDPPFFRNYFTVTDGEGNERGFNWTEIPLIPFKYNSKEIPLINMVKTLQDGLNVIESNFQNCMEEDTRNTILVLKNYDGENLGEFRRNLAVYGAVKVNTVDGSDGDLSTLKIEVNSENYKTILRLFKNAIIENAMGFDAKDDRLIGSPNQLNIKSMYSDTDLDANGMETEFQASFERLLRFINAHLANTGVGDFDNSDIDVIFNRDILISESEVIENCRKSVGILSDATVIAMHPWVSDPAAESERIKTQNADS